MTIGAFSNLFPYKGGYLRNGKLVPVPEKKPGDPEPPSLWEEIKAWWEKFVKKVHDAIDKGSEI